MGIYANTNGTLTPLAGGGGGSGAEAYSLLEITFDAAFLGLTYTLYADSVVQEEYEIYTRTVPASLKDVVRVKQCSMRYVVECTVDSKQYTNSITTADYFGEYKMHLYKYHIYGARWTSDPSTVWERTDDAAEFTDPVPYVAGSENYGSPFDNIYPWNGMIKEEDSTVGTLVKLPKFYYKLTEYGNGGLWIRISDKPVAGFEICPACRKHYTAVGDPEDYERDAVYIGRYISDSTYKSLSGKSWFATDSFTPVWARVHKLNPDAWVMDYDSWFTVVLLYLTEFANWSPTVICEPAANLKTGGTNDMPYHTGTMGTGQTASASSYQYRYIEAPYSSAGSGTYVAGCIVDRVISSTIIPQRLYAYDRLSTRYQDMATITKGEPWSKDVGTCYEDITVSTNLNYTALNIPTSFKIVKGFFTFFLPTNGKYYDNEFRTYGYATMSFNNTTSSDSILNTSFMTVGHGANYISSGISACGNSGGTTYTRLIFRGIPDNPVPN